MIFQEKLEKRIRKVNSLLCVGLDSDFEKIPDRFRDTKFPQFEFNKWIIEQTHEYVSAYKPNTAFYEARGEQGIKELKMTLEYLRDQHPGILLIADAKRGDIGSTSVQYAASLFEEFGFDAATVNPYGGKDSIEPFLKFTEKGVIVWCKSSNPGARDFQDKIADGLPLWQHVAKAVINEWNARNNCMLVMGASYPTDMKKARELAGDMVFLVPGIDTQGGKAREVVKAGLNSKGRGLIINASRSIIFAADPKKAAQNLRDEINRFRS